ncbi:MAG: hypothetical protein JRJ84_22655 [Deltaproteobacteria bacterium]|nr:hypothetical protein [Deltaproteobacteria bacterium]
MPEPRYACFEIRTECDRCGQPVPLNGPALLVTCPHCFSEVRLPEERIADLLDDFENDYPELEPRQGHGGTLMSERTYKYGYWRLPPRCPDCKKVLPEVEIGTEGTVACEDCGRSFATFPPEDWLAKACPSAKQVIGADPPLEERTPSAEPSSTVVALSCPSCGGGLRITEERSRIAPCDYCEVEVYLPDEVWARLHPVEKVREWWVRFEGPTKAQLEAQRRLRDREEEAAEVRGRAARVSDAPGEHAGRRVDLLGCAVGMAMLLALGILGAGAVYLVRVGRASPQWAEHVPDTEGLLAIGIFAGMASLFVAWLVWQHVSDRHQRYAMRALRDFAVRHGFEHSYSSHCVGVLDGYEVTLDWSGDHAVELELKQAEEDWHLDTDPPGDPDEELVRFSTGDPRFDGLFPVRYTTLPMAKALETSKEPLSPLLEFLDRWGGRIARMQLIDGTLGCHLHPRGPYRGVLPPEDIEPLVLDTVALARGLDEQAARRR